VSNVIDYDCETLLLYHRDPYPEMSKSTKYNILFMLVKAVMSNTITCSISHVCEVKGCDCENFSVYLTNTFAVAESVCWIGNQPKKDGWKGTFCHLHVLIEWFNFSNWFHLSFSGECYDLQERIREGFEAEWSGGWDRSMHNPFLLVMLLCFMWLWKAILWSWNYFLGLISVGAGKGRDWSFKRRIRCFQKPYRAGLKLLV
jgi:hypothetical protein